MSKHNEAAYNLPERVASYDADMEVMHPNWAQMHETVDAIHELFHKYWMLINLSALVCPPPHGWERIFDAPFRKNIQAQKDATT